MNEITFVLNTKELERIAAGLDESVQAVIETLAFEVETDAKLLCPVDTGALRNSIYTRTKSGGGVSFRSKVLALGRLALSGKRGKKGTKASSILGREMAEIPAPEGDEIAVVGTGMEYAAYVEFGTHRMAAQPYLGPATEKVVSKLNKGETWKELFK